MPSIREASDLRELRKYMGVGEMVKRDKANYRLKLSKLDDLPRSVTEEVLKEVCRVLDVGDVTEVSGIYSVTGCLRTPH